MQISLQVFQKKPAKNLQDDELHPSKTNNGIPKERYIYLHKKDNKLLMNQD